ncbi:MAG: aldehyde ferredoxin oxidoreductase family protein [Deltaproteobacteria bacterium]|nr:aldehyde ferredoxin oxidoreductase family protein [Deltaproteobacteria bacterium]
MKGYAGTILRLDLGSGRIEKQPLPGRLAEDYIGGRGFVARLMWEELPPGIDPFDPANPFITATGPMSGHLLPASGKTHFGSKSPATGGYADSNMGGHFGPTLKYAGYDGLVLTGAAAEPSLLVIDDESVEIRPAGDLWGMGSLTLEKRLKEDFGEDFEILTIGPAGENLVRFACISHDFGRQAGRTGIGAVLGSKKIKAVLVRGTGSLEAHDLEGLFEAAKKAFAAIREKPGFLGWTPEGTAGITNWVNEVGAFPTRNFQTSFSDHYEAINGKAVIERLKVTDKGCFCCPTPCGKYGRTRTSLGRAEVEGPEFESIALLGGCYDLQTIEDVAYANYLCDELGLDSISGGVVSAWAVECFERGILSREEIGREIRFGDLESLAYLLDLTAHRKGLGDPLAEGSKRAAGTIGQGSLDFAIQVKGLEWTGYECRNAPGMMLSYMTADVGPHHNRSWVLGHDVVGSAASVHDLIAGGGEVKKLPKAVVGGQSKNVIASQHLRPAFDLLGVCRLQFMELGFEVEHYEELFRLCTGRGLTWQGLLETSERVWNLTRSISLREIPGFGRDDDYPPARLMNDPVPNGPNRGHCLSREEIDQLLDEYYDARGWDRQGRPTAETLKRLGLEDVAEKLDR